MVAAQLIGDEEQEIGPLSPRHDVSLAMPLVPVLGGSGSGRNKTGCGPVHAKHAVDDL